MRVTKKQAEQQFRELWKEVLEANPSLKGDTIAKREQWFYFIDNLRSERSITLYQYNSWASIC